MSNIITFLRLNRHARGLFFSALVRLAAMRIALWFIPFKRLRQSMVGMFKDTSGRPIENDPAAREILWAVEKASRCLFIKHCLTRALVAKRMFRRQGYRVDFRIGVSRTGKGKLEAHAWLESNGRVVIGHLPTLGDYTTLPLTGAERP